MLLALLACWFAGTPGLAAAAVERVEARPDRIVVRFDPALGAAAATTVGLADRVLRPDRTADGWGGVGLRDARLTVDLSGLTAARPGRGAAMFGAAAAQPAPDEAQLTVPPAAGALALPRVYGDDPSRPLVVIDPGHGGPDPGAIAPDGRREKDVTLRLARAIRDELVRSGRVRAALTRDDDRFLVLQERYGIARRLGAMLFISIHCDSAGEGEARGASVYTLSEVASDKQAARLAARENKADIIGGTNLSEAAGDVSSILIDLTQRETMTSSARFARLLGREASELVPLKPNYHRMAALMVLKAPDLPSILLEAGYISNPADLAFIDSRDGRARIAQGVRRAVQIHFARRLASAG